jgi:HAMP domain-containing protein
VGGADWPTQILPAYATTADWRRICLDRQLPKPRFPAGVKVPAVVCLIGVVLLSALSLAYLGQSGAPGVSDALLTSQREIVAGVAHSIGVSADYGLEEVTTLVRSYQQDGAHDAAKLVNSSATVAPTWRGVAVVGGADHKPVAVRGDPIPVDKVPGTVRRTVRSTFAAGDGIHVLVAAPLVDGRILVGSALPAVRLLRLDQQSQQTVLLATGTDLRYSQGTAARPDDPAMTTVRAALRSARTRGAASAVGKREHGVSGLESGTAPVAVAARAGNLDLYVVSLVHAPLTATGSWHDGVAATAALLLVGCAVFLLLWLALVRPLQRLLAHAKAVASGGLGRHARPPMVSELRRIVAALYDTRATVHRRPGPDGQPRRGVPAAAVLVVATMAVLVWSGAVVVLFSGSAVELPSQITADAQNQVEAVAASVRGVLERGLSQLADVARENGGRAPARIRPALQRMIEEGPRYRSLYVAGPDGRVLVQAGKAPLRHQERAPDGDRVYLDPGQARVPTIVGQVRMADGRRLVGEFDIRNVTSVLHRIDGRVRLVDGDLRTVLDTEGYLAFEKLSSGPLCRSVQAALTGRSGSGLADVHNVRSLVAAAPLTVEGSRLDLHWAVVFDRAVREFSLPVNEIRRGAWMVAICGVCLSLLLLGWLYFVVVRPLRALAEAADRLAAGDLDTVISPARQDEIGALGVCLDICRQAKAYGNSRLAGAGRLRGQGPDRTLVLPRVPVQRDGDRTGSIASQRRR